MAPGLVWGLSSLGRTVSRPAPQTPQLGGCRLPSPAVSFGGCSPPTGGSGAWELPSMRRGVWGAAAPRGLEACLGQAGTRHGVRLAAENGRWRTRRSSVDLGRFTVVFVRFRPVRGDERTGEPPTPRAQARSNPVLGVGLDAGLAHLNRKWAPPSAPATIMLSLVMIRHTYAGLLDPKNNRPS